MSDVVVALAQMASNNHHRKRLRRRLGIRCRDGVFYRYGRTHPKRHFVCSFQYVGTIAAFVIEKTWRTIWRIFPALQTAIFPDLNGIWSGTLVSTWIDPHTGKGIPPDSDRGENSPRLVLDIHFAQDRRVDLTLYSRFPGAISRDAPVSCLVQL